MGQIGIWESFHQSHFGNYFPETPIIKFVHRVFQKEDLRGEQQVVDLGCGSGNTVALCANLGLQVHGVDFSASAIEKTRRRLDESGLKAELHVRDMTTLPNDDESVDAVIDSTSIQHVPTAELPKIFSEIHRILKPGSRFFGMMIADLGLGEVQFQTHLFTKEELQQAFNRFESVQLDYLEYSDRGGKYVTKYWLVEAQK